jgi:hypothetical protein
MHVRATLFLQAMLRPVLIHILDVVITKKPRAEFWISPDKRLPRSRWYHFHHLISTLLVLAVVQMIQMLLQIASLNNVLRAHPAASFIDRQGPLDLID